MNFLQDMKYGQWSVKIRPTATPIHASILSWPASGKEKSTCSGDRRGSSLKNNMIEGENVQQLTLNLMCAVGTLFSITSVIV